jgi:hypothetical protein
VAAVAFLGAGAAFFAAVAFLGVAAFLAVVERGLGVLACCAAAPTGDSPASGVLGTLDAFWSLGVLGVGSADVWCVAGITAPVRVNVGGRMAGGVVLRVRPPGSL